jgi:TPR repeat protein
MSILILSYNFTRKAGKNSLKVLSFRLFFAFSVLCLGVAGCGGSEEDRNSDESAWLKKFEKAYESKQYKKAFKIAKNYAKNGNHSAQFKIATMYQYGKGVDRDLSKAIHWYETAEKNGSTNAKYQLGHTYRAEDSVRNMDKAIKYYKQAASSGDEKAELNLCLFYVYGEGVSKNVEKGLEYCRGAAKKGYARAMFELGVIYGKGEVISAQMDTAYGWFYLAKKYGDPKAVEDVRQFRKELPSEKIRRVEQDVEKWAEAHISESN